MYCSLLITINVIGWTQFSVLFRYIFLWSPFDYNHHHKVCMQSLCVCISILPISSSVIGTRGTMRKKPTQNTSHRLSIDRGTTYCDEFSYRSEVPHAHSSTILRRHVAVCGWTVRVMPSLHFAFSNADDTEQTTSQKISRLYFSIESQFHFFQHVANSLFVDRISSVWRTYDNFFFSSSITCPHNLISFCFFF